MWEKPSYKLKAKNGKYIFINVATSGAPGSEPNKVIIEIINFFKREKVEKKMNLESYAFMISDSFFFTEVVGYNCADKADKGT